MVLGLWLPLSLVALQLERLGDLALSAHLLGFALFYLIGCLSAAAFVSSLRRHPGRTVLVSFVYAPFLPAGILFTLAGGLYGVAGTIVAGTGVFILPWGVCRAIPRRDAPAKAPGAGGG